MKTYTFDTYGRNFEIVVSAEVAAGPGAYSARAFEFTDEGRQQVTDPADIGASGRWM